MGLGLTGTTLSQTTLKSDKQDRTGRAFQSWPYHYEYMLQKISRCFCKLLVRLSAFGLTADIYTTLSLCLSLSLSLCVSVSVFFSLSLCLCVCCVLCVVCARARFPFVLYALDIVITSFLIICMYMSDYLYDGLFVNVET